MTGMPMTPYMQRMPSRAKARATTVYPFALASAEPPPALLLLPVETVRCSDSLESASGVGRAVRELESNGYKELQRIVTCK